MKLKNLRKKIRRLEKRLKEGPKKLAKLKQKLEAAEAGRAMKGKRQSPAQTGGAKKLGCQESEEKTESLTGTPCPTCGGDEGQMGCQESR